MLLDIISKRYPHQKPSDYLGIEDSWTAFQLDSALAMAGETRDRDFLISLVESINDHLVNVMRSMGAKIKKKAPVSQAESIEGKPLNEVLARIGGAGVVVNLKKKDGNKR